MTSAATGTLGEGIRANAWACRDGRVIVDCAISPSNQF
jgi:hypothetical protein